MIRSEHMKSCSTAQIRFMLFKGPGSFNVDELKGYRLTPLTPPLFFHFTLPLKVVGNKKGGGREGGKRLQYLCLGPWRSRFTYSLNIHFLRKTLISFFACSSKNMRQLLKGCGANNDAMKQRSSLRHTVKKSYLLLEGRCKFPAPSLQKFVVDTGKFFPFLKVFFLCFQRGKPFHSGQWAFFHV